METLKLFSLIEKSFSALKRTNKKIWIIGIIISIFSGGLIIQESFYYDTYPEAEYDTQWDIDDKGEMLAVQASEAFLDNIIGFIDWLILMAIILVVAIFIIVILVNVITYYLYHSVYETLFDTQLNKASLGLVVKVNLIIGLKVLVGLIFFIIPGIIVGFKYAPANYILCKHPELSSKEVLNKTKELSKGFKWKIFIFNSFITIISCVVMILCSPTTFIYGYIWLDVLDMIITFIITTFMVVYTGIFNTYLFKGIENVKETLFVK